MFVALSMTVVLAAAAMVIDGGNAMAQQRGTQNATDAAALAGALTLAQDMGGENQTDSDVDRCDAASVHQQRLEQWARPTTSTTTTTSSAQSAAAARSRTTPRACRSTAARTFDTFLAGIVGHGHDDLGRQRDGHGRRLRSICSAETAAAWRPSRSRSRSPRVTARAGRCGLASTGRSSAWTSQRPTQAGSTCRSSRSARTARAAWVGWTWVVAAISPTRSQLVQRSVRHPAVVPHSAGQCQQRRGDDQRHLPGQDDAHPDVRRHVS